MCFSRERAAIIGFLDGSLSCLDSGKPQLNEALPRGSGKHSICEMIFPDFLSGITPLTPWMS